MFVFSFHNPAIILVMLAIFTLYFFLLGLVIGSFLNVVILRHNTGKSTGGRSACMVCNSQLTYRELFPVFSFLFQKGKCKNCKTRISWQYPLVELATGALFATNFYFLFQQATSMTQLIISVGLTSCIWALMIIIFVYDLRHKIIPDVFSFGVFGMSVVYTLTIALMEAGAITRPGSTTLFFLNIFAGIIFYLLIYIIWKFSKGRLIGLGDAKLLLSIGTILGIVYGLSAIFIAVWIGAACALLLVLKQKLSNRGKHITMRTEIPLGPFLILGFLIVYFSKIDVTNLSFILENL